MDGVNYSLDFLFREYAMDVHGFNLLYLLVPKINTIKNINNIYSWDGIYWSKNISNTIVHWASFRHLNIESVICYETVIRRN